MATSYVIEMVLGSHEIVTVRPKASTALREIELAAADGYIVKRILCDYVEITETALKRHAKQESFTLH